MGVSSAPNARPTPQHSAYRSDGKRLQRLMRGFCELDLPQRIELPSNGRPGLFAGNHRSFLDVFVTVMALQNLDVSCHLLVRADLFDKPGIGHWLRRIGCIPMSSKNADEAIQTATAKLNAGHLVAIMPEGRLVPASDRPEGTGPARQGVSIIAKQAGAEIIPVAFHNTDAVWPRGSGPKMRLRNKPLVTLRLGTPFELTGADHQANADQVMLTLRSLLHEIDNERA